jgi:hypothetical protein
VSPDRSEEEGLLLRPGAGGRAAVAAEILSAHNRCSGTAYEVVREFEEGLHGAFEVRDAAGRAGGQPRRAVLKVDARLSFARHGGRLVPVAERARAAGYPTPAVISWGRTADGTEYYLQELVPGEPLPRLTVDALGQLLALNDLQAGVPLDTDQDWSGYVWRVVFAGESGWAPALRSHSRATEALLAAVEALVRPLRDVPLPSTDLVHGDFATWNVLALEGRVTAVVDLQAAGRGTRAIDLARVLGWEYGDTDEGMRRRLIDRLLLAAGPRGTTLCLAYTVVDLVAFAVLHGTAPRVEESARTGRRLLDLCRALG